MRNSALLGIHTAVPLPSDAPASLSRDLPTYVSRDADTELRRLVGAAATGSGFVLIMGCATAGKSRSAFEVIQQVVPNWRLYLPSLPPARPDWADRSSFDRGIHRSGGSPSLVQGQLQPGKAKDPILVCQPLLEEVR